jgi:hypothetical protein
VPTPVPTPTPTPPTGTPERYNIFVGHVFDGQSIANGIMTYFYPLDMNNSFDRAYFYGDSSENVYKNIYYRTARAWGASYSLNNLRGGGVFIGGSGQPGDVPRIIQASNMIIAFVYQNGRCPTRVDLPNLPIPNSAVGCRFEQSLFKKM